MIAAILMVAVVLVSPVSAACECKPVKLISEKPISGGGLRTVFQNPNRYAVTAKYSALFRWYNAEGFLKFGGTSKSFTIPGKGKLTVVWSTQPNLVGWDLQPIKNGC